MILTFFWAFIKIGLINLVTILMMSAKTLGLLKIKVLWNIGYDLIVSVHNNLSWDSNNIANAVMWPKFGNSNIYMRNVIINSTL